MHHTGGLERKHDVLVSATRGDLPDAVRRVLSGTRLGDVPPGEAGTVDAAGMRWAMRSWGDPADPPVLLAHGIMSDGGCGGGLVRHWPRQDDE